MKRSFPPLSQITSFIEVVARGRLSRAAEALELTESAVSHHLRKLEDTLGVRLLERNRASVSLTPAGERFHARAAEALRLLDEAITEIRGVDDGKVVLTLPRILATHWLVPHYPELYRECDELELQFLPTVRECDLEREQIDLGVRRGSRGEWPGLEAKALVSERICPVAVPALADQWRQKGWSAMVNHARIIANQAHADEWSLWCDATGRDVPTTGRFVPLESFDLVLQAGLAGSGPIMGRSPMVEHAISRGDLVAPFPEWVETGIRYFVIWPERRPPNRHAQRIVDWLQNCAAKL